MVAPPIFARVTALVLAFISILGMSWFSDDYFGADDRANLLIYGAPVLALVIGGIVPTKFFHRQPSRALIAAAQFAAIPMLGVAIYRDVTLINGADWPAAILRAIILGLTLVFLSVAVTRPQRAQT